jgi:hypothetical protein
VGYDGCSVPDGGMKPLSNRQGPQRLHVAYRRGPQWLHVAYHRGPRQLVFFN